MTTHHLLNQQHQKVITEKRYLRLWLSVFHELGTRAQPWAGKSGRLSWKASRRFHQAPFQNKQIALRSSSGCSSNALKKQGNLENWKNNPASHRMGNATPALQTCFRDATSSVEAGRLSDHQASQQSTSCMSEIFRTNVRVLIRAGARAIWMFLKHSTSDPRSHIVSTKKERKKIHVHVLSKVQRPFAQLLSGLETGHPAAAGPSSACNFRVSSNRKLFFLSRFWIFLCVIHRFWIIETQFGAMLVLESTLE